MLAYELATAWRQIRFAELIADEIAMEFDGVDPLKPANRTSLDQSKQALLDLHGKLDLANMSVILKEFTTEDLEEIREFISSKVD